jgi:hypothetical protein
MTAKARTAHPNGSKKSSLFGNYLEPKWRPLTVYAFDPGMGRTMNNYMTIKVPYEKLKKGPIGRKIAVIDYDASNHVYYEPVDLDRAAVTLCNGLEPSESDPRFHQQMVYAVASETIRNFEFALGRPVKWRRPRGGNRNDPFRRCLRVFPHAFQQANAFYDQGLRAVLFGYFRADRDDVSENLPGQIVFTCLSHDIIVHEVTHAILDGMREHFSEATSFDTPAFHEGFADIVALLQHFTIRDAIIETIRRTGGFFYRSELDPLAKQNGKPQIAGELTERNPLVQLGRQFGQAMGMRKSLREALGTPVNTYNLENVTEPHHRGAVLVAAVFDAYFTVYVKRTRDLMRIARANSALDQVGDIHPDLAERLTQEAMKVARQFCNICIRAIDYCPPVDIRFGEYLRALVTADSDVVSEDKWDYRGELIKAFRLRGIIPEDVFSYSEESLRWQGPEEFGKPLPPCRGLIFDVVKETDETAREENRLRARRNAQTLSRFANAYPNELGLDSGDKRRSKPHGMPIQVYSYHPTFRIAPDGRLVKDFVVEFLQQRHEKIDPGDSDSPSFVFRGGSTVIFDEHGNVRHVIQKRVNNERRLALQREYQAKRAELSAFATFDAHGQAEPLNFAAIHRGF